MDRTGHEAVIPHQLKRWRTLSPISVIEGIIEIPRQYSHGPDGLTPRPDNQLWPFNTHPFIVALHVGRTDGLLAGWRGPVLFTYACSWTFRQAHLNICMDEVIYSGRIPGSLCAKLLPHPQPNFGRALLLLRCLGQKGWPFGSLASAAATPAKSDHFIYAELGRLGNW